LASAGGTCASPTEICVDMGSRAENLSSTSMEGACSSDSPSEPAPDLAKLLNI
jgi:hypothetical protein